MFLAQGGTPPLATFALTTLGGALAAGGASAINSSLDRDIDGRMNRTARRPIPNGTVAPHTALAFGLAASIAAVLVLGLGVNWLAAVLALAGNVCYVFIYTVWLKRRSPRGIVFGGGAGAIPPLVGWAAVDNRLGLLAILLFLIVLYWTPPHTWALGLLLRADYERVGVPLLPVVRGEAETAPGVVVQPANGRHDTRPGRARPDGRHLRDRRTRVGRGLLAPGVALAPHGATGAGAVCLQVLASLPGTCHARDGVRPAAVSLPVGAPKPRMCQWRIYTVAAAGETHMGCAPP
jgi:hypothetical protein